MEALGRLISIQQGRNPGLLPHNAHVHLPPNFSAFDTLEEALNLAQAQNLALLGASNYYDYRIYESFIEGSLDRSIYPLLGMEIVTWINDLAKAGVKINDPGNPGKAYLTGKGIVEFASPAPKAASLLRTIRECDSKRMSTMVDLLVKYFNNCDLRTGLNEQAIIDRIAARHEVPVQSVVLQERHVAMGFQEALFATYDKNARAEKLSKAFGTSSENPDDPMTVQGEIRSHLMKAGKPAYVEESFISFTEAVSLVRLLGGIPCYPVLADGVNPICGFEASPEKLIADLKHLGIPSVEFIPNRNDPKVLEEYVVKMRHAGLVVGAGTEHNTLDRIPMTPSCKGGQPIPEACRMVFWEAACVFAAHQHRRLHNQPGYESYRIYDARWIVDFAAEGAALIGGVVNNRDD